MADRERLGVELGRRGASGRAVDWRLPDADLSVMAIHPNQITAIRPLFAVGGTSDGLDSLVLAEFGRARGPER